MSPLSPIRRPMGQAPAAPSILQNPTFLVSLALAALAALYFYTSKPSYAKNPKRRKNPRDRKSERVRTSIKGTGNSPTRTSTSTANTGKSGNSPTSTKTATRAVTFTVTQGAGGGPVRLSANAQRKLKGKGNGNPWKVLALRFPKKKFTRKQALHWAHKNGYKRLKGGPASRNFWSFRNLATKPDRYRNYRTWHLKDGVLSVVVQQAKKRIRKNMEIETSEGGSIFV